MDILRIASLFVGALGLVPRLLAADLTGVVFLDRNGNGRRDPGEPGVAGVAVSDQVRVVQTGPDGSFRIVASAGFGAVFVSVPDRRAHV